MHPRRRAAAMIVVSAFALGASVLRAQEASEPALESAFEPAWESLAAWECPEWYRDAKFGVMIHWGIYSVPAHGSERYPRSMYIEGSEEFGYHRETFGDQGTFGYKDFILSFTGESFDAAAWALLLRESGARYVVPVAEHHDGFAMYDSAGTEWDAAAMGPKRDVIAALRDAVRAEGMRFGVSTHRAYHWNYYRHAEGLDTIDPANAGLYGEPHEEGAPPSPAFLDEWLRRCAELVEGYSPDLFWFDFGAGGSEFEEYRKKFAAYYYTRARNAGSGVVINYKGEAFPPGAAVLAIDRGKLDAIRELPWQTDTSVCYRSRGYIQSHDYRPAGAIVHDLVDIVSKNGSLLLNIAPRADGVIPEEQQAILREIGGWLAVNGESIYGTRPWLVFGEGPAGVPAPFQERTQTAYTAADIRFTQAKDRSAVYAIVLGDPGAELTIQSLLAGPAQPGSNVELLGHGPVAYRVDERGRFVVDLPAERPSRYAIALKFVGFELDVNPAGVFVRPGVLPLPASRATIEGSTLRLQEITKGEPNLGYWSTASERAHWLLATREPGVYAARGRFAAANGPTRVRLRAEGWSVEADVPQTPTWGESVIVEFPEIEMGPAGVRHVVLEAADEGTWRPINVWTIEFARLR